MPIGSGRIKAAGNHSLRLEIYCFLIIALFQGGPLSAGEKMVKYSSGEVRIYTDLDRDAALGLADRVAFFEDHIDGFFRSYGLSQKRDNPIRCRIFSRKEDFLEFMRKENEYIQGGAYFSVSNNAIVAPFDGSRYSLSILLHECTHQIIRRYFSDPMPWVDEGFATYFEAHEFDPQGNLVSPCNEFGRKDQLRALLEREEAYRWEQFFDLDNINFWDQKRRGVFKEAAFYAQAWGVVFFYLHGGGELASEIFTRFIKGMNTGREREELIEKDFSKRSSQFEAFLKEDSYKIFRLYQEAQRQRGLGNLRGALETLVLLLDLKPENRAAQRSIAEVCFEDKRWEISREFWEKLSESEPEEGYFLQMICRCLVEQGLEGKDPELLEQAVEAGKRAVKSTRSRDPLSLAALARAYHASGDPKEALETMRKATQLGGPALEEHRALEKSYLQEVLGRGG